MSELSSAPKVSGSMRIAATFTPRSEMNCSEATQSSFVDAVMTTAPKTVRPDQLISETLDILNSMKVTALFAVEAGRPVGVIHVHDLLRAGAA